jgi:hypothetical protein
MALVRSPLSALAIHDSTLPAGEDRSLPGRHIIDSQIRQYMSFRQAETSTIAAAKAGFSAATANRIEQDRKSRQPRNSSASRVQMTVQAFD